MASALGLRCVILSAILGVVMCGFDEEICQIVRESTGLIPPPLPTNFEFRGEEVDHKEKTSTYQEMYYDYSNSRGKLKTLHKGIEHHLLFDYEVQQIVEYYVLHPGSNPKADILSHVCTAENMFDSPNRFIFGLMDEDTIRPKMYSANQLMRFGGQYRYAYDGTDFDFIPERRIPADKFVGCVYDPSLDATINATYFFTNRNMVTSGGTYEETVTGFEGGVLSVPIQADLFGSLPDEEGNYQVFNKTMSWFYFQGEPDFSNDVFKIPPYMYCKDFMGRYAMQKLPDFFSTRLQVTSFERDILGNLVASEQTSFEQIYYYREKNLARRDFESMPGVDTEIFSKFGTYSAVKTVFDFNQGLVFVTNQGSGRCYVRTIAHGDYFDMSENMMFVQLGSPEDVFRMHTDDMEYKGTDFARDIECDVWTGKYYDKMYNATYVKETYTSTNGWHDDVDEYAEYAVPVKHTVIKEELGGEFVEGVSTYNFLKFKKSRPHLYSFDVSNCIDTIEHQDFALRLEVNEETRRFMYVYTALFIEQIQFYITQVSQLLTPLRVQRLQLSQLKVPKVQDFLTFTMVGKPVLNTKIPVGQRGPSLDTAIRNLRNFIDTNQFNMRFFFKNTKDEFVVVQAPKDSLYVKTANGNLTVLTDSSKVPNARTYTVSDYEAPEVVFEEPLDDEVEPKGMKPGNLALLAVAMLFIGLGIGIACMYLYIRKFSEQGVEDRIVLSHQPSYDAEAGPSTSADNAKF